MERVRVATVCAVAVLAVGLATACHEAAHVVTGWLAGGSPTLLTSTEVWGDFGSLSPLGFVVFGASGSVVNALFCALGWWILRRRSGSSELQLFAWFLFAVNGLIVTMKMVGETVAAFGDWMTVLRPLPATDALRVLVALLGAAGLIWMVRRSGALLAELVPAGEPTRRKAEARRIVAVGALAATVLVLGSSVASPVGATRATLLALGAGLGPFVALFFGTRFVGRRPATGSVLEAGRGWPWWLAAGVTILVLWFGVGPGVELSRWLS